MAKYVPFGKIAVRDRKWPDNEITRAPVWCSVDLRDGNQALAVPMGVDQKLAFFDLLVRTGFKEIEVGFPSASQTEFDFLRRLIEEKRIPDDVTVQVLCQARGHLVRRTFEALKGIKSVIFHIYNSTSPAQRKYTFGMTKEQVVQVALDGVRCVQDHLHLLPDARVCLEYSPESFSNTEIGFAVDICRAVKDAWGASPDKKIILNLPSTVECSTANVYADQIEYFIQHIGDRDSVIISLHNHNDRGGGVSSCELGLLAGADRVEGTLFGNGERTGNLDIVTVAMNMYTQGIDPGLDFSSINDIRDAYIRFTGMPVHPRHPYAGELVFTAFSGSHQDAIRKGMAARSAMAPDAVWDVPYLPIDPHDVGREYEEIIRINSQSGKGGAAWVLEQDYGIFLPKAMHPVLGAAITGAADSSGKELSPAEIYRIFEERWLKRKDPLCILDLTETHLDTPSGAAAPAAAVMCRVSVNWRGDTYTIGDMGNGPLDAFVAALRKTPVPYFSISAFHEHSVGTGNDTDAMAYIEITAEDGSRYWGCGKSSNIGRAGIDAIVSAINQI